MIRIGIGVLALSTLSCGSPILDHDLSRRPVASSASAAPESPSTPSPEIQPVIDAVPGDCQVKFENSKLCAKLSFLERPSYQASLKSFSAQLEIWDSDKAAWASLKGLPVVFHQYPLQCCLPPPISVQSTAGGRYQLSNIEFHAEGLFDFYIEIELMDGSKDRVMVSVDVASH